MVPFTDVTTEDQLYESSMAGSPQLTKPEPFCSFCLRERPQNVEFYKHVLGCSLEMRTSLQSLLGYEFNLANFAICKPCWKMVQLIQDFRLRCFKDQMQQIGRINLTKRTLEDSANEEVAEDSSLEESDVAAEVSETGQSTTVEQHVNVTRNTLMLKDSADEEVAKDSSLEKRLSDVEAEVAETQQPTTVKQLEKHECTQCKKTFNSARGLQSHTYYCVELGQGRPLSHHFKEQLKTRGSITPSQCRQNCDKLFFSEPARAHHERICGEDARNLGCETCGRRFTTRASLRIHQRCQHSENARIFPCDVCGKMFMTKAAVSVHLKCHLKEKEFKCEFCWKMFDWKQSLRVHVKAVHVKQIAG